MHLPQPLAGAAGRAWGSDSVLRIGSMSLPLNRWGAAAARGVRRARPQLGAQVRREELLLRRAEAPVDAQIEGDAGHSAVSSSHLDSRGGRMVLRKRLAKVVQIDNTVTHLAARSHFMKTNAARNISARSIAVILCGSGSSETLEIPDVAVKSYTIIVRMLAAKKFKSTTHDLLHQKPKSVHSTYGQAQRT
jgi:hypothetical protein